MPQMAPMSWLLLFMFFILFMFIFSCIIFFYSTPMKKTYSTQTNNKFFIKW